MYLYKSRYPKLSGSDFKEVKRRAQKIYNQYVASTKRQPYIRSKFFHGNKVFLSYFWIHLWTKNWRDRMRRLKYLPAALDLIKNTTSTPSAKSVNDNKEVIYRFYGVTADRSRFYVQIKQEDKSDKKYFVSVFPESK